MAGGIKGITVKIGGDTTELGKALSQATTKSTALQKELRGVNSLLKFDPKNVTLLKQKSDLLTGSIAQTNQKLKALVEVQKKVDSGEVQMTAEEYRNLQREIASTEHKLKSLNEQAKEFGSVNAQRIAQVGEKFKTAGATIEGVGKKVSTLSTVTGAVLGGSVMSASKYEDALAKVGTIADTSKVSMKELSGEIMTLSNQTGVSASEIADATYNAISAGQDTADAVTFVSNATSLAKAGFTDTASSLDVLSTIMNAYGLEAGKVDEVSDMLIQTQNKGKTTVAELSASMGKVIPTANSMNVGLNQLCAGYSIMTARGISTAESTTYMNSMLNELGKSGTKVSDALKEKTGKSFQDLMAEGKSLGDVLQILKTHADESGVGFNDLWSSSEAGKAGLTLLSDGASGFNEAVAGMNNSVGATSKALKKMETPSQKAKVAINQLKNAGITLGQNALSALAPLIDKIAKGIKRLTEWFNNLSPGVQQIILVVLALVTALGPALIIIGKLISSVGTIMTIVPKVVGGIKTFGAVIAGINAPILAIIAVIGTLVGAFLHLWNTNKEFRNNITKIWNGIVNKFKTFFKGISDRIKALGIDFKAFGDFFKTLWEGLCNFLVPIFEGAFKTVSNILGTILDVLTGLLDMFIGLFTLNWEQFSDGICGIFKALWDGICEYFTTALDMLKGIADVFCSWFGTTWDNVWNTIKDFFVNTWNSIKNFFSGVINGIKNIATTVFNAIGAFFTTIWNAIKNTFTTVLNIISGTVNRVFNGLKFIITTVLNAISTFISNVWNGIKVVTSTVWNTIKTTVSTIINGVSNTISSIFNGIKNTVSNVWNGIKSATTNTWNAIKNAITSPIETAKRTVSNIINGIKNTVKNIFNGIKPRLNLSLPKISVSGGKAPWGIMGKGRLPSFNIKWNKLGAIFNKPTIFDTRAGYQGVGEAGPEAVAPISELMKYVTLAVNNGDVAGRIARLEEILTTYLPNMNNNTQIVLDTGVLVGETINHIDAGLASNQLLKARGV